MSVSLKRSWKWIWKWMHFFPHDYSVFVYNVRGRKTQVRLSVCYFIWLSFCQVPECNNRWFSLLILTADSFGIFIPLFIACKITQTLDWTFIQEVKKKKSLRRIPRLQLLHTWVVGPCLAQQRENDSKNPTRLPHLQRSTRLLNHLLSTEPASG